jgi:hypothetical protein
MSSMKRVGERRVASPTPPLPHSSTPITCPFCVSDDTERISLFGSQLLVSQYRCRACHSYFEAVRDDESHALPPEET